MRTSETLRWLKERYKACPDEEAVIGGYKVKGVIKNQRGKIVGFIKRQTRKGKLVKLYLRICTPKGYFYAHTLMWAFTHDRWPEPGKEVDHIQNTGKPTEGLDNRPCNLREFSKRQQQQNRKLSSNNKTGRTGLSYRGNSIVCKFIYGDVYVYRCFPKTADGWRQAAALRTALELEHYVW